LSYKSLKLIEGYFSILRCRVSLHKKISDLIDRLGFKSKFKNMVQLYLIHYQKGKTEEILDNLASDENEHF